MITGNGKWGPLNSNKSSPNVGLALILSTAAAKDEQKIKFNDITGSIVIILFDTPSTSNGLLNLHKVLSSTQSESPNVTLFLCSLLQSHTVYSCSAL